jgi:drug/metabolite transporter (DMT)-like permease
LGISKLRPHIYSVAAIILFSTIEVVGKLIGSNISPYAITAWRFLIGGIVLLPYAIKETKEKNQVFVPKDYLKLGLAGVLVVCVSMLFLQLSVYYGKAALSAVIVSSNPLFVAIFALLILKEKINWSHVIGLVVGLIGLFLIIYGEKAVLLLSRNIILGVLFGLGAALTFAIYTVYSKKLIRIYGNLTTLCSAFLIGSVALFAYSMAVGEVLFFKPSFNNLAAIAYLSIFVTGIAYILYFKAITHLGTSRASLYFFLKPAVATLLSRILLKEMLNSVQIVGILFIMLSLCSNFLIDLFNLRVLSTSRYDKNQY